MQKQFVEEESIKQFPFFSKTDGRCEINGNSYPGIPVFFDENGVIRAVSDYMIHQVYEHRKPSSTVATYAYHLQKFLKFLLTIRLEWRAVTDGELIHWRDRMIATDGLAESTVAAYLATVFKFYQWAEESGILEHSVALYRECDQEDCGCHNRVYKISAEESQDGTDFIWPYLPTGNQAPNRHTPVSEELEKAHIAAFDSTTGQRDSLIMSFYEELCLRRAETLNLLVIDIPTRREIEEAEVADKIFTLTILGKGNKKRFAPVLPEFMSRTRDYIEEDRAAAVRRAKQRNPAYSPPEELFVGKTTGKPLAKQYLSRRISELMRSVGIENASGHRIRASGLTSLAIAYDGADESGRPLPAEQVLWKVADRAGHASWTSLKPYLNLARSPAGDSVAERSIRNKTRLNLIRGQIAELSAELGDIEQLREISNAIWRGHFQKAERLMKALHN